MFRAILFKLRESSKQELWNYALTALIASTIIVMSFGFGLTAVLNLVGEAFSIGWGETVESILDEYRVYRDMNTGFTETRFGSLSRNGSAHPYCF